MSELTFKKDLEAIKEDKYSDLAYSGRITGSKCYLLSGDMHVIDDDNNNWGDFSVQLIFPSTYPHGFPEMIETDGRIPKKEWRHINIDGTCCTAVKPIQSIESKRGIRIQRFIDFFAIPFLANQIYFDKYGKYPNGDYQHGLDGIIQYYKELFQTDDSNIILNGFKLMNNINGSVRNLPCYCRSGKKLKKCHLKALETLKSIQPQCLQEDYELLLSIKN